MVEGATLIKFYMGLTKRQREVLYWVSQGLTNAEVAAHLCIRSSVVAGHLTQIYASLGAVEGIHAEPRRVFASPNRYLLVRLFWRFFEEYRFLRPVLGEDR